MKSIQIKLSDCQIRRIAIDKATCAQLINEGKCSQMLDLGLSVIDLHGLLVTIEKAIRQSTASSVVSK